MLSPALRYAKSLQSYNPIPDGCDLYLPFWSPSLSGLVFRSAEGKNRLCIVTGTTLGPQGRVLDGDDKIAVAPVPSYGARQWIFWIKLTSDASAYILGFTSNLTAHEGIEFNAAANRIDFWANETGLVYCHCPFDLGDTAWHHVAIYQDGQNPTVLANTVFTVDGVQKTTTVNANGTPDAWTRWDIGYMNGAYLNATVGD